MSTVRTIKLNTLPLPNEVAKKDHREQLRKRGHSDLWYGIGMAITANKFPGVYAAVCHDNYSAERARFEQQQQRLLHGCTDHRSGAGQEGVAGMVEA